MALTNYTLKAGAGSTQNKTGRFFNVITCFYPLKVVIKNNGRELLSTQVSAGMTFDFEGGFDSIEFYSDVTQSIEYWASNVKLTFEGGQVKEAGAAFIKSRLAGAMGGGATILVSARKDRRRVMLESVDNSVWIGGEGVTSEDGWELKQGERLQLDIAGDVFSWWTNELKTIMRNYSGAYQTSKLLNYKNLPINGTQITEDQINTAINGKWLGFNGDLANGQVVYVAGRSDVEEVADYFDVFIPAGYSTIVFDFNGYMSAEGNASPCIGVSWGDANDLDGKIVWNKSFSTSGSAYFNYSGATELYIGESDEPRFKRVFFWDASNGGSYLDGFSARVLPARRVKVIELSN